MESFFRSYNTPPTQAKILDGTKKPPFIYRQQLFDSRLEKEAFLPYKDLFKYTRE